MLRNALLRIRMPPVFTDRRQALESQVVMMLFCVSLYNAAKLMLSARKTIVFHSKSYRKALR
jgi:hypothetical protein